MLTDVTSSFLLSAGLGSTLDSRVGDGVLAIANFSDRHGRLDVANFRLA